MPLCVAMESQMNIEERSVSDPAPNLEDADAERLSRFLALVLRHRAYQFQLDVDDEGFVPIDDLLIDANRFENLRSSIASGGRDPHLGTNLEEPVLERLQIIRLELRRRFFLEAARTGQGPGSLQREVGEDCRCAISDQCAEVMDIPDLAGLANEIDFHPQPATDQIVMNRCHRE